MTSIYAASSIHSKSTLSKKYEVDMSAMWNGGEKLRVKADESHDQFSFSYYLQQYSMDVGRFNELPSWLNTLRMIVFPFYLILDSTGVLLTNDFSSQFFNTIITILKRCIVILPLNASINTLVTFNFSLIIIYAALMYLLFKNILKYRSGNVPSRSDIYSWILNSRILCPILSSYISYYFSKYLFAIVGEYTMNELYNLMISIPIIIMHSTYVFYSCAIYNATPLIRPNDITQLWYAHSCLDRRINMVLYVLMFFQSLLTFFSSPIKEIAHFVFVFALASFFAFNVLRILPAVAPKYNTVIIWAALASLPLTLFPLVSYYTEKYALYYFIGCIIFIPIAYFIAKKLVTIRCRRIIDAFTGMRESEDEEGEDNNLDPLSAAILHLNQNTNVDFLKLNISGEHQISLYLRVGFLFHIPEVEDQSFIKWSIDQTVKADLLLSACQISYALKNDFRMLNSLSVHVDKLSSGPFNSRSFALLFDLLRQESLTQLNQPLLSNIQHCKHESYTLQNFCSEFWGNVIKQRIQCMNDVIPQISNEFTRTENLFQNLIRNYPLSSTAYRETVIIYHKVLGNHEKTLELQAKLNKIKKIGDVESERSSSSELEEIDRNFQEQMDPWLSAQAIIKNIPSRARRLVIFTTVIMIFIIAAMPLIQLIISLFKVKGFLKLTLPIQIIGSIQMQISRIPQLIRRISLYQNNEIKKFDVGPVAGHLVEFSDENSTRYYLDQYINNFSKNISGYLDSCTDDDIPYEVCANSSHRIISGGVESNSTLYNMLSSYLLAASNLKDKNNFSPMDDNANLEFLFQNFDAVVSGVTSALGYLNAHIISFYAEFQRLCDIYYFITIIIPIVFIVPLTGLTIIVAKKEIKATLRLFFGIPKNEIAALRWNIKGKYGKGTIKREEITPDEASQEGADLRKDELLENLALVPRYQHGIYIDCLGCCTIFVTFSILMSYTGICVFHASMRQIIQMANAYTYSITVFSHASTCYVWAQEYFSKNPVINNRTNIGRLSLNYIRKFQQRFYTLLYGSTNLDSLPGLILGTDINDNYMKSQNIDTKVTIKDPVYGIMHDVYYSLSCEAQVSLFNTISLWILDTDYNLSLSYDDEYTYHFEHILFGHIIPYLNKGMDIFSAKVNELNVSKTNDLLIVYILLFVMQLIFVSIFVFFSVRTLIHHIMTPRRLLQLVPPECLMKSPAIVKWFSGNSAISEKYLQGNKAAMNNESVEFACDSCDSCGVALCDEFLEINNCNATFLKMAKYTDPNNDLESVRQVLMRILVDKDKIASIQRLERSAKKMSAGVSKNSTFSFESSIATDYGELKNVVVTLHACTDGDEDDLMQSMTNIQNFAIVIKENTQIHMLEETIAKEKEKLEKLMLQIMPQSIRQKQNEVMDACFQADIASVIVGHVNTDAEGEELVKFVSSAFNAFDGAMDGDTFKIRTCGMYYICICGLFSKPNSQKTNAVEVALKMILMAQKNIDSSLGSVSIGIHSGVVKCGMVGQSFPVFDVLGDTSQGAMKLCDTCPPWLIHVSERTYNEIKYMKYYIKEIGSGDERNKTYLVSNTGFSN